jgi:hypothetical protein
MILNQQKEVKEYITTSKIDEQTWMRYFIQLYSNETDEKDENDNSIMIIVEVSNVDVSETVLKLRNRNTPAEGTITNEMLKVWGQ